MKNLPGAGRARSSSLLRRAASARGSQSYMTTEKDYGDPRTAYWHGADFTATARRSRRFGGSFPAPVLDELVSQADVRRHVREPSLHPPKRVLTPLDDELAVVDSSDHLLTRRHAECPS